MIRNFGPRRLSLVPRFASSLLLLCFLVLLTSCGGKSKGSSPQNTGGGFTLIVSGGTLNDGSGTNGLSILATLRDSQGRGPIQPWTIDITDPDNNTLTVVYDDIRPGSYKTWEWAEFAPSPGTYRATATNGATTLHYNFTVDSSVLPRPVPNASVSGVDITVSWPTVTGAGSYAYQVCSPDICISDMTTSTSQIVTFGTLTTGDYTVEVKACSTDLPALSQNKSASPTLASHDNVSTYAFTYPVGSSVDQNNFSLVAAGGVLDYDYTGPTGPIYGLPIWVSLQDTTNAQQPAAPAGDWNIVITDPNGLILNYIYPAGSRHYAYWYYGIEPVVGTYTVTATYGSASTTATFTLADTYPRLTPLLYTDISSSLVTNATDTTKHDVSLFWPAVSNAKSYYVSLWGDVWNNTTQQWDYQEVWGNWVNTTNALVANGSVTSGLLCDVFVSAYEVDMTSAAPPTSTPSRVDMSENYYGYQFTMP